MIIYNVFLYIFHADLPLMQSDPRLRVFSSPSSNTTVYVEQSFNLMITPILLWKYTLPPLVIFPTQFLCEVSITFPSKIFVIIIHQNFRKSIILTIYFSLYLEIVFSIWHLDQPIWFWLRKKRPWIWQRLQGQLAEESNRLSCSRIQSIWNQCLKKRATEWSIVSEIYLYKWTLKCQAQQ